MQRHGGGADTALRTRERDHLTAVALRGLRGPLEDPAHLTRPVDRVLNAGGEVLEGERVGDDAAGPRLQGSDHSAGGALRRDLDDGGGGMPAAQIPDHGDRRFRSQGVMQEHEVRLEACDVLGQPCGVGGDRLDRETGQLVQQRAQIRFEVLVRHPDHDFAHRLPSGIACPPSLLASNVSDSLVRFTPTSEGSATSRTSWANAEA